MLIALALLAFAPNMLVVMRLSRAGVVLVFVLLSTACSSGSGGGKVHVASTNGHPDPAAIATKIGCTGYATDSGSSELFTATGGQCKYKGTDVTILTFASSSAESKWRDAAKQATGGTGTLVIGDRFAVEADNADQAAAIATAVGGTTQ